MILGKKTIGTVAYMGGVMSLPEPFVWSWSQMIEYNSDYITQPNETILYNRATVSYHSFARNSLVKQMRGDWLFMLDTDLQFDPDALSRMLFLMEKHNIDVLTGLYQFKSAPFSPILYLYTKEQGSGLLGKWEQDVDIFEVGSAGGGCLLVKRKVFDRIKNELKQEPFDIKEPYSEDHSFFQRLKDLKIKAYCAPNVHFSHLAYKPVMLSDYDMKGITFSKKFTRQAYK